MLYFVASIALVGVRLHAKKTRFSHSIRNKHLNKAMAYQLTRNFVKLIGFTSLFIFCNISAFSQQPKRKMASKSLKCATYVHNLSSGERKLRDICFSVTMTGHYDSNNFGQSAEYDKKNDTWRFAVKIVDNTNYNENSLDVAYFIHEENADIIQYHCRIEGSEIKAVILNKNNKSWQILLFQNDVYKILNSTPTYGFFNAFNIKNKANTDFDY